MRFSSAFSTGPAQINLLRMVISSSKVLQIGAERRVFSGGVKL